MQNDMVINITALKKMYDNGFKALNGINPASITLAWVIAWLLKQLIFGPGY
jgi:hypothetical protein